MVEARSIRIVTEGERSARITDVKSGELIKGVKRVVMEITPKGRKCSLEFLDAQLEGEFLAPGASAGVQIIAIERSRQIEHHGWTPQHDAQHKFGELAQVGACYAKYAASQESHEQGDSTPLYNPFKAGDWPASWNRDYWRPSTDPARNLAKAGALIAADLDRRAFLTVK
ncbi:MAG: hypothetical protein AB9900_11070 [Humidesulfovibrio sp.]